MPSKYLHELMSDMPKENKIFVELSLAFVNHVHDVLEQKGWNQKDLAQALQKNESEVSKWLSGGHNLTFRSISKLMAVLDTKLIEIPHITTVTLSKREIRPAKPVITSSKTVTNINMNAYAKAHRVA